VKKVYEGYLYMHPYCGDFFFVSPREKEGEKMGDYEWVEFDWDTDKWIDLGEFVGRKVRITIEVLE